MNKVLKRISVTVGVLFLIILFLSIVFILCFNYILNWKLTDIATIQNDETGHKIILQEKGSAFFFGPSHVKVILVNADGKVVNEFESTIWNDGGKLYKHNIAVNWFDDYIEIVLSGEEQKDMIYEIKYD